MSLKGRSLASSFAFLLLIGTTAQTAHAWPFGRLLHLHPRTVEDQDSRLTMQLYNNSGLVQKVSVSGRSYTLLPHDGVIIKAVEGTEVFAESPGFKHRKGDVLFAFSSKSNGETVTLH